MSRIFVVLLSVSMLAFSASAVAKGDTIRDLRLAVGFVPGIDEVEFDGPGGTFTADSDGEAGLSIHPRFALGRYSGDVLGFVMVFGVFYRTHSGEDAVGDEVELTAFGTSLAPGIALRVAGPLHFELTGELDLGWAEQSITGFTDGLGPYAGAGLNAGLYLDLLGNLQLGGEVGVLSFISVGEIEGGGSTVDTTFSGSGLQYNLSLGYSF